jgi:hypothetical protein
VVAVFEWRGDATPWAWGGVTLSGCEKSPAARGGAAASADREPAAPAREPAAPAPPPCLAGACLPCSLPEPSPHGLPQPVPSPAACIHESKLPSAAPVARTARTARTARRFARLAGLVARGAVRLARLSVPLYNILPLQPLGVSPSCLLSTSWSPLFESTLPCPPGVGPGRRGAV